MTEIDVDLIWSVPEEDRMRIIAGLSEPARRAVRDAIAQKEAEIDPLEHLDWRDWNREVVPSYTSKPYAPHHVQFWEWTDTIQPDVRPDPFAALWPRGHTKSTCAEIAVVKLGCRRIRTYFLYVSFTQDQADDHVGTIGAILESPAVAKHYPLMAEVKVNKFGSSRGWRRNRLRTKAGFTIDALGLDVARRGAKLEETRPDGAVFDDIDDQHASERVVTKNRETITNALIPALQPHKVIIVAQNLVAANSIGHQLSDRSADMLGGAIRSGPFPAVEDMRAERRQGRWVITQGRPTWAGMDLEACSDQMTDIGEWAYRIECQQDISERPGAIWRADEIDRVEPGEVPELARVIVSVDPNKTGRADDAGVVVIGLAHLGGERHAYVLADYSDQGLPSQWRETALRAAIRHQATTIVVEKTGLGEHAELTLKGARLWKEWKGKIDTVDADLGKKDRARPVWALYVEAPPRVHHVGVLPYVERQMTSWEPDKDPMSPGGIDALAHGVTKLLIDGGQIPQIGFVSLGGRR